MSSAEQIVDCIIDMVVKPLSSEVQRRLKTWLQEEKAFQIYRFTAVDVLLKQAGEAMEASNLMLRQKLLDFLCKTPFSDSFLPDLAMNDIKWITSMVLAVLAAPLNLQLESLDLQERGDIVTKRTEIKRSLIRCLNLEHVMKNPEQQVGMTDQARQ